jgi:formamidopyrimidine-DNA glycosylase
MPRGKHLLITFRDPAVGPAADLILHTHLGMTGSWHAYHTEVPWKKPERLAKVVLHVEGAEVPFGGVVPCGGKSVRADRRPLR